MRRMAEQLLGPDMSPPLLRSQYKTGYSSYRLGSGGRVFSFHHNFFLLGTPSLSSFFLFVTMAERGRSGKSPKKATVFVLL